MNFNFVSGLQNFVEARPSPVAKDVYSENENGIPRQMQPTTQKGLSS